MSFLSISIPMRGLRETPAEAPRPDVPRAFVSSTPRQAARREAAQLTGQFREAHVPAAQVLHDLMVISL